MSNSSDLGAAPRPVKEQTLVHLGTCLTEWHRALSHGGQPVHPDLTSLRDFSARLLPQLGAVGFGGIACHLGELILRVDAAGTAGDPCESLSALYELTEQARCSLDIEERSSAEQPLVPISPASTLLGLRAFGARDAESSRRGSVSRSSAGQRGLFGSGAPNAPARNVKDLLGGIERNRGAREPQRVKPQQHATRHGRRVRAIALASIGAGLVGLVFAVVVMTRRASGSGEPAVASAIAAVSAGMALPGASVLPGGQLLAEGEKFSSLLAQVHGRGRESSELQALVDEQAALVAHSQRKCEGSAAECDQLAKLREGVLGTGGNKRIARRRQPPGSPGRVRPRWLAGFELPELPIEDDPRVQRSLEYYTEKTYGRELFQSMLFRCGAYREAIESTLVRHGLPKDLLAVVFAESGCEPEAVSPVGASGLWQLMPDTARAYGLRVKKGVIDERRNAQKSTEAAVRFLRDLRDKMAVYYPKGVWDLVLGSYNMGPFAMAARVEHAGGDIGFWDLVDAARLPDETVHYTPTVQALALILRNQQRFKFAGVQLRAPQLTSELEVKPGTRLSLIARAASTSLERIRTLNLDITGDRTPDIPSFAVQVPKEVVWQARDTLAELTAAHDESDQCVLPGFDWGRKHFTKDMADTCKRKRKLKSK